MVTFFNLTFLSHLTFPSDECLFSSLLSLSSCRIEFSNKMLTRKARSFNQTMRRHNSTYDLVVIGGGPGGYVGAIKAAQLGLKVFRMHFSLY